MSELYKPVTPENSAAFGAPLLRALGIDPASVAGFKITCDGGDWHRMELRRLVGNGSDAQLTTQQYRLCHKADGVRPADAFAVPLLRSLGIDPGAFTGFEITCNGGDFPRVELHRFFAVGEGEVASRLLAHFEPVLAAEVAVPIADRPASVTPLNSLCAVRLRSSVEPSGSPA